MWRYIDNIFFIWEYGEDLLKKFANDIISFHPTIKQTANWSKKVNFLDIEITLQNGVLSTNVFVKPNDTHQILDPTSYHPSYFKSAYLLAKH